MFTSNVDGHFQKAGFPADNILEIHGSLSRLQCMDTLAHGLWSPDASVSKVR